MNKFILNIAHFPYFLFGILFFVTACGQDTSEIQQNKKSGGGTQEEIGLTAADLRQASLNGQLEAVKQAVNSNIEINAADQNGRTPLMLASFNGHTAIVELLVKHQAEVNAKDKSGRTALMFASSGPFPETVAFLLDNGANPNAVDQSEEWTPLMFAAAEGNTEVVKLSIENNADVCPTDKDGETALDFAVNNNHKEVSELLKGVAESC